MLYILCNIVHHVILYERYKFHLSTRQYTCELLKVLTWHAREFSIKSNIYYLPQYTNICMLRVPLLK